MMNHLWQSTVFAVCAGLLTLVFRQNRASIRYWLWLAASVKFLIPFSLLMNLGTQLPAPQSSPAVSIAVTQAAQPFPETIAFTPAPANTDWILTAIWASGLAVIAVIRLRGWLSITAAVRASTPIDIPAAVPVRSAPGLLEPGVVGIFRPILLLPAGIIDRLTPAQLTSVLAHELCHVRRRDNLSAAIHMFVEAVFWLHPLVWWIGARLVEERERACDETVLSHGSEPQVYAEAILNICKLYVESPLVCFSGVTGADLKRRVTAIMANRGRLRLNFAKKAILAMAGLTAVMLPIAVGVAQSIPKFDVASIRRCKPEPGMMMGSGPSSPGRLTINCIPLVDEKSLGLIQRAYVMFAKGQASMPAIVPITGGPDWIRTDLYQINATAEGNPGSAMMQGPMLQALLEDRFQLRLHRETKEMPVYGLTVAKGGSKLKPFVEGSCVAIPKPSGAPPPPLDNGRSYCKVMVRFRPPSVVAEGATIDEFVTMLNLVLHRPAFNQTGLTGRFSINLEFAAEGTQLPANAGETTAPSVFTAIQEQLGLRLSPTKGPREFIVIDHMERPSEN